MIVTFEVCSKFRFVPDCMNITKVQSARSHKLAQHFRSSISKIFSLVDYILWTPLTPCLPTI